MDNPTLRKFFGWCTIINLGIMVLTFVILALFGDTIYGIIHVPDSASSISREAFSVAIYGWIGIHRAPLIVFSLVPWISLMIVDKAGHV